MQWRCNTPYYIVSNKYWQDKYAQSKYKRVYFHYLTFVFAIISSSKFISKVFLSLLNKLPVSASNLYAKNVFNFISNLYDKENKKININLEDEIIEKTLIK